MRFGFWKFLNDPKSKFFLLLQITQNGPIRENKWLKPKSGLFFWKIWMTLPLQCLRLPDLVIFRQFFRKHFFFAQNDSKWFNSWKKVVEIKIWDFRPPNGSLGPRLSHFTPIFKNEDLVNWICLILHFMIVLNAINHLKSINYLAGWHNVAKWGLVCAKKFKISILYQFFDLECLNMIEIAHYDSANCS